MIHCPSPSVIIKPWINHHHHHQPLRLSPLASPSPPPPKLPSQRTQRTARSSKLKPKPKPKFKSKCKIKSNQFQLLLAPFSLDLLSPDLPLKIVVQGSHPPTPPATQPTTHLASSIYPDFHPSIHSVPSLHHPSPPAHHTSTPSTTHHRCPSPDLSSSSVCLSYRNPVVVVLGFASICFCFSSPPFCDFLSCRLGLAASNLPLGSPAPRCFL